MDPAASEQCTVFDGARRIASGPPEAVLATARCAAEAGGRVQAFDDATGRMLEFDLRPDGPSPVARGRGRPKLGVTAREVTLLPRHWDWLAAQPGGASVALRKLVEEARRDPKSKMRAARDTLYRFSAALVGNAPGFEEAIRALYAGEKDEFLAHIEGWPEDVRVKLEEMAAPAFG